MHPLRLAYIKAIKKQYDLSVGSKGGWSQANKIALQVTEMGLSYAEFFENSFDLWHNWCKNKGMRYPYWNVITCQKALNRMEELVDLEDESEDGVDGDDFVVEMMYAEEYVQWFIGNIPGRPRRLHPPSLDVKMAVAEELCHRYGYPAHYNNYTDLARKVAG